MHYCQITRLIRLQEWRYARRLLRLSILSGLAGALCAAAGFILAFTDSYTAWRWLTYCGYVFAANVWACAFLIWWRRRKHYRGR
jgi:hypothetical protein